MRTERAGDEIISSASEAPSDAKKTERDQAGTVIRAERRLRQPGPADTLQVGDEFNGYVIKGILISKGETGEAEIYLVEKANHLFTLKYYLEHFQPKMEIVEKLKGLTHPNIVQLVEYGYHDEGSLRRFYEIQQYAAGGTLLEYLPIQDISRIKQVVKDVIAGLRCIHQGRIFHRDIKPANLFVGDKEKLGIMLGDFGISSMASEGDTHRKTANVSTMTPDYAAPEQVRGDLHAGIDYYSLGVSLVEIYLGKHPYQGLSKGEIIDMTVRGKLQIPQGIPPELLRLIRGLTVLKPEKRWGHEETERWLRGEEVQVYTEIAEQFEAQIFMKDDGTEIEIRTPDDMADFCRENPNQAAAALYRGHVEKWLAKGNRIGLSNAVAEIRERNNDQKAGPYKLMYTLDPNRHFRTVGGKDCTPDRVEIGNALEDEGEYYLREITQNPHNELFCYLEVRNYGESVVDVCRKIIERNIDNINRSFNEILLVFQGDGNNHPLRLNAGTYITNPQEILHLASDKKNHAVQQMLNSDSKLSLWLKHWEIAQQVENWRKVAVKTEFKEIAHLTAKYALTTNCPLGKDTKNITDFDKLFKKVEASEIKLKEFLSVGENGQFSGVAKEIAFWFEYNAVIDSGFQPKRYIDYLAKYLSEFNAAGDSKVFNMVLRSVMANRFGTQNKRTPNGSDEQVVNEMSVGEKLALAFYKELDGKGLLKKLCDEENRRVYNSLLEVDLINRICVDLYNTDAYEELKRLNPDNRLVVKYDSIKAEVLRNKLSAKMMSIRKNIISLCIVVILTFISYRIGEHYSSIFYDRNVVTWVFIIGVVFLSLIIRNIYKHATKT